MCCIQNRYLFDEQVQARLYRRVEEVEPNFYREAHGQTMHFFSEEYCHDVLRAWSILELSHQELRDDAGNTFKCVWRCVAQRPAMPRTGSTDLPADPHET